MSIDESLQTQQFSPGEKLASARKALGLTLEEVAQALKITSHFVRAIESDQYQRLPGDTFAKGYLRLYAELLSLDAEPLVAGMQALSQSDDAESKGPLIQQTTQSKRGSSKLTIAAALVLLVGGGVWWFGQDSSSVLASAQAETDPALTAAEPIGEGLHLPADNGGASPVLSLVEQLDTELELRNAEASTTDTGPASAIAEESAIDPVSSDSAPGHIGPVEIVVPAERSLGSAAPLTAPPRTEDLAAVSATAVAPGLSVAFLEDCWLKISDGQGKELFSGVKAAGSTLELDIDKPFQIRFGNAPGVGAIHYQQQPLTLNRKPGRSVAVLDVN